MDVDSEDKAHSKNVVAAGENKKGKEGENNLKEVVVEDETGVSLMGGLEKTKKRGEISFFKGKLS